MQKRTVAVVGLGYVGLPLAVLAREKGWRVVGLDVVEKKIEQINTQESPIADEEVAAGLRKYPIRATTDPSSIAEADVIVIAVPTPVTHTNLPDLAPLVRALESIRPHLRVGQTLVVESTINPGVMDEVVVPTLRQRSDLALDADGATEACIYLAHCPERINPGDAKWTVRNIPRVIGGYSKTGVGKAKAFYESMLEAPVKEMKSVKEAEAVKIMENTFRDVNIAFINEMAKSFAALGIDIMNVIEGASTKPFAFMPHYPGNGVGGHCISVDPYYMIERARQVGFDHEFLSLARLINDSMPAYTVQLMEKGLRELGINPKQASVALLGLAYKKDIDDLRNSPAVAVRTMLEHSCADVRVFDPYVPAKSTVKSVDEALAGAQACMIGCDHTTFVEQLTPEYLKQKGIKFVVDGKNALDADGIAAQGILYIGVGRMRAPNTEHTIEAESKVAVEE